MNINDLDKIKVPKELNDNMKLIYKKYSKSDRYFKLPYTVIACILLFVSGFAFSSYTKNFPVYSQIFSIFEKNNYQEFGDTVLMEKESNGIKVTISDIIYTGYILSYSYIIESDKNLGEDINVMFDLDIKNKNVIASGGEAYVEYKGNNTYIGYEELRLTFKDSEKEHEKLDLRLNLDNITSFYPDYKKNKEYKGDWKFAISVKKLDNIVIKPEFVFEEKGISLKIDKLIMDKAGIKLQIKSWDEKGLVSKGHSYVAENAVIKSEDGEVLKLNGGSAYGDKEAYTMYYDYDKILSKGSYIMELDFNKEEFVGHNEKGERERVKMYDTKEYKEAPESIKVSIPFEI